MSNEMNDLVAWVIKMAKSAGADDCRAGFYRSRFVDISYRNRKPENIKEASNKQLGIDFFVNGRYSSQSTSDLRKEALKDFISNAVTTTKLLAKDPFRSLPDPKYYKGRENVDLGLVDPAYRKHTPESRHKMVKAIENSCLSNGGDKVISVTARVYDSRQETIEKTSNGFDGQSETTVFYAGAQMTVKGEGDRRPMGYHFLPAVNLKGIPSPEKIGAEAARRTLSLLGGKKIKTETLPVIIENRNVPRLLGGFLSGMYGRNIQQKQSFLADKKGKKVGSKHFTILDDPFITGGLGSQLFDNDGFAAKKRTMIDKGILKDFYVGWYYSRKLGWEPTTSSPSNLVIPPGKRSVKEIMKDLGRGIFITGFIGGNSNSTTGDASVGILGHLFEDGKPVQAVSEMNIAGNHLDFWSRLVEVANDPWTYSSYRIPSLVFADTVVSGI